MVERIQRFFRHQIRQRESFSELPVFFKDFCISDIAPADHALKIQTGCHKTTKAEAGNKITFYLSLDARVHCAKVGIPLNLNSHDIKCKRNL